MHCTNSASRINEKLNSILIAHNIFYHLHQGPDGTSIPTTTMRRTGGGLKCKERDYMKERNPSKKGVGSLKKN